MGSGMVMTGSTECTTTLSVHVAAVSIWVAAVSMHVAAVSMPVAAVSMQTASVFSDAHVVHYMFTFES